MRILVGAHGDGCVLDEVEDEDEEHEGGSQGHPADVPVVAHPVADHLLNAAVEPLGPEDPADGDGLEEDAEEERHSAGSVEIHQLEHIDPALSQCYSMLELLVEVRGESLPW